MRRLLDIDLRLIRIFRAIAEAQGIAGAQVVLNLSQSRISAGLTELEGRLGVRLCRRGRSGFALTEAGTSVYEASRDLFEAVDRFSNSAGAVAGNLKRVLRIGSVDAVVTNPELRLSNALLRFRRETSGVTIDFSTSGPEDLERQLLGGSRDVVILPSLRRRPEFDYVRLLDEKQSLYCGRTHPLFNARESVVTTAMLGRHAFVARGYMHSKDLKRIGHRRAEATVETMEAQLILILTGEFIGYLPAHYAGSWTREGELRPLMDRACSYESTFFAVSHAGTESPLVRRFISNLGPQPAFADAL